MALERFRKNSGRDYRNPAVKISCADANGDQRKHIEAAVDDRLPPAGEEKAAGPKNNHSR